MSRPDGYEHDVFCPSERWIDYVRGAAARMARDDRCPVRIHRHSYRDSCTAGTHELVGTVDQMQLAGFVLPREVTRGRA